MNNEILKQSEGLRYTIKDTAPNSFKDLKNESGLIVWSGASDGTIYQDRTVNWAFRAIHDALHLKTGLDFSPEQEIELGRIQASRMNSSVLAEIIYCEVSLQAKYYLDNGIFVPDQIAFTKTFIKGL